MKYRLVSAGIVLGMLGLLYFASKAVPVYLNEDNTSSRDNSISVGGELLQTDLAVKGEPLVLPTGEKLTVSAEYEEQSTSEGQSTSEEQSTWEEQSTSENSLNSENADSSDAEENEYANLAIAHVTDYVNVRSAPNTEGEILGKIYNGAVAQVMEKTDGEDGEWFHVTSGSVEGYIKSEYFIYGQDAADVIDEYVTKYAQVQADRLNVRKEPSVDAKRVGYLDQGERALLLEDNGEWMKVKYDEGSEGYVASEFVLLQDEFVYAKSIEEERKELERLKALEERKKKSESQAPEKTQNVVAPPANYGSNSELRDQIVTYAKQFLGNKYVHGGNSLKDGTDCSGFTSLIYADFGYSVGRTPASQLSSAGRAVDYSNIQKGDIICYGKNGKCTHVALYIGDGQIIHEANSRKGVVIYQADYDTILGVRNVID